MRAELENEALTSIAGLELTNANYEAVVTILKERYGNTKLILDTHYTQLMEMPPAINKTASLRTISDKIEEHLTVPRGRHQSETNYISYKKQVTTSCNRPNMNIRKIQINNGQ